MAWRHTKAREDGGMEQSRTVGSSRKDPGVFRVTLANGQTTGHTPGLTAGLTEQPGLMTPELTCAFKCTWIFAKRTSMEKIMYKSEMLPHRHLLALKQIL